MIEIDWRECINADHTVQVGESTSSLPLLPKARCCKRISFYFHVYFHVAKGIPRGNSRDDHISKFSACSILRHAFEVLHLLCWIACSGALRMRIEQFLDLGLQERLPALVIRLDQMAHPPRVPRCQTPLECINCIDNIVLQHYSA
jgi:hypothetical protein